MNNAIDTRGTTLALLAQKAASSALLQQQHGSKDELRELYYEAHSLLRTLRSYLARAA